MQRPMLWILDPDPVVRPAQVLAPLALTQELLALMLERLRLLVLI